MVVLGASAKRGFPGALAARRRHERKRRADPRDPVYGSTLADPPHELTGLELAAATECLSGREREVVWARYGLGMTYREIAQELDASEDVVVKIHTRALARLCAA
jgi:DNA-directed RNA polymerase specialized sigma24 family protein